MKYYLLGLMICLFSIEIGAQVPSGKFLVQSIQIEGLHGVSKASVLNQLPIQVGEQFDATQSNQLLKQLYATGFFDDIQLERINSQLKIKVVERPIIEQVQIEGNLGA